MRGFKGLGSSIFFLLLAAWPNLAPAQMTVDVLNDAPAPVNPKIVLQTFPYGGIEIAAWTRDDRYIITASQTSRMVMIWDAETGYVVDRLPIGGSNVAAKAAKTFTEITVSEDNQKVKITERLIDSSAGKFTTQVGTGNPTWYYTVDLKTREVQMMGKGGGLVRTTQTGQELAAWQSNAATGARNAFQRIADIRAAMERKFENGGFGLGVGSDDPAKVPDADLPPLPSSYDGTRSLHRLPEGLLIKEEGGLDVEMKLERNLRFHDAALSPDGVLLAMVPQMRPAEGTNDSAKASTIEMFDLEMGTVFSSVSLPPGYAQIQWLDNSRLLATPASDMRARLGSGKQFEGLLPRGVVINADTSAVVEWIKPQCYLTGAPGGVFFGAGLANCRARMGKEFGLKRYDPKTKKWAGFGKLTVTDGTVIASIAVSPSGQTVAVNAISKEGKTTLSILDGTTGALMRSRPFDGEGSVNKIMLVDDEGVFISSDRETTTWGIADDAWQKLPLISQGTKLAESNGTVVAVAGTGDEVINLTNIQTGERMRNLALGRVIAGGFLTNTPIFWAMSAHDGVRLWNTGGEQWTEILTTYFFDNQGFLSVTPEGRYDTNLGPDTSLFRWLVPDRPFQSLAPQTFMRDYFTPKLAQRTIECNYLENCGSAFPAVTAISELNRVLPQVEITGVRQGDLPNQAIVSVKVTETEDKDAPANKSKSGAYDLRLFRDYRYTTHSPEEIDIRPPKTLADWQQRNKLVDDDDSPGDGVYHKEFKVLIATAEGKEKPVFSAYAFNEHRVKSETVGYKNYTRPAMKPARPRAFVISIGIDSYQQDRLNLNYAAADAKLLSEKLKNIPGYEMRNLVISSEIGKPAKATANAISVIFALLGGYDRADGLATLAASNIDGAVLEKSLPDDIVIFTFSGHGYADEQRNFFLLPTEAVWADGKAPQTGTFLSTPELTSLLRNVDAAEIVMIIDACYAGASVDDGNFKPGPMGDPGLGQLAYDKGIKILVATQANDVAMENDRLKQGLLTFALAGDGEGFAKSDGLIDAKKDQKISLDEWVNYPIGRLPTMNDDKRVTGVGNADDTSSSFRFPGRTTIPEKKIQQPTLFDYGDLSPVSLGRVRK